MTNWHSWNFLVPLFSFLQCSVWKFSVLEFCFTENTWIPLFFPFYPIPSACVAAAAFSMFRITLPMFQICYKVWYICTFLTIMHNHWFSLMVECYNLKTIIFCSPHSRLEVWENVWPFSWSMILYFTFKKCMLLYVWDYIWLTDSWKIGEYETICMKLYILPMFTSHL